MRNIIYFIVNSLILIIIASIAASCRDNIMSNDVISENDTFTITGISVKEDSITIEAISGTEIISYADTNGTRSRAKTVWRIDSVNTHYPLFSSNHTLIDALYNMAIDEISTWHRLHFNDKSTPTRDISYPILLALARIDPYMSMSLLSSRVKNGHVIQDATTDNLKWPVINDRIVWASAAWEVYKVSGDKHWLEFAYNVIQNTINEDANIIFDYDLRLTHGAIPAIDNSPSKYYPEWMHSKDIFESMPLSTNILYANTYFILAEMADELKIENDYRTTFNRLKNSINQNLWIEKQECYSAYLYGAIYRTPAPMIDNLGQALSIIWDIAEDDRAANLLANTPFPKFGIPQYYPLPDSAGKYTSYPYMQAMWNIAAAKDGNESVLRHGLGALYRSPAIHGSHKCKVASETGELKRCDDTTGLINASGNIAMILHVFAGMVFHSYGIEFNPVVPMCLNGTKIINGFKYRQAILDITIEGAGNEIDKFMLDDMPQTDNLIPDTIKGYHTIKVILKQGHKYSQKISFVNDLNLHRLPATPSIICNNDACRILNSDIPCTLVVNGEKSDVESKFFNKPDTSATYFQIATAVNRNGFMSAPIEFVTYDNSSDSALYSNNCIHIKNAIRLKLTNENDTCPTFQIKTAESGKYFINLEYDVNFYRNDYIIYSILVNTHKQGALILPLSHKGGQSSNQIQIELIKGSNTLQLNRLKLANNKQNDITLKYFRVIKNNFNN